MFDINAKLKAIREESGYTTVVQEHKTCYTVAHARGYDGAPVEGHMIPFLDGYDDYESLFLALPLDHQPNERFTTFQLSDVAEQDLPKLVPGTKFWRVVSLEDNKCGSRQRSWRLIFEE